MIGPKTKKQQARADRRDAVARGSSALLVSLPKKPLAPRRASLDVVKRVAAPSILGSVTTGNVGSNTRLSLRRKEYVGDVVGSVGLTVTKYSVNPGLSSPYIWGSQIANNYEEYDTMYMAFHYEPEAPTSVTGVVIIAFDFDAADVAPTTKQQLLTFADNVRVSPWLPASLVLKVADLRKRGRLFVRNGAIASTDIKTYDLGNVYVATVGQANTNSLGEFWIGYHHQLDVPTTSTALYALSGLVVDPASGTSKTNFYGTTSTVFGAVAVVASSMTLTFNQVGQFLVVMYLTGTSVTTPTFTGTATITTSVASAGTAPTNSVSTFSVVVTAAGQTVVWTDGGSSTVTDVTTYISPMLSSVVASLT